MASRALRLNSTNVRPDNRETIREETPTTIGSVEQEDAARTLAFALLAWGAGVIVAALSGVFARLSPATFAALALFAAVFAVATYLLDRSVRAHVRAMPGRHFTIAAMLVDTLLVAIAMGLPWTAGLLLENLAAFPFAVAALFLAPLALALHAAQIDRWAREALRKPAAKSPGVSRVAT